MQSASHAILILFTAVLGLWPVVFILALLQHLLAKRWRRVGQVALLLPIWTMAASVGLTQVAPFVAALDAPPQIRNPLFTAAAIGLTLFFAALAWGLLVRSFGGAQSPGADRQSIS